LFHQAYVAQNSVDKTFYLNFQRLEVLRSNHNLVVIEVKLIT